MLCNCNITINGEYHSRRRTNGAMVLEESSNGCRKCNITINRGTITAKGQTSGAVLEVVPIGMYVILL